MNLRDLSTNFNCEVHQWTLKMMCSVMKLNSVMTIRSAKTERYVNTLLKLIHFIDGRESIFNSIMRLGNIGSFLFLVRVIPISQGDPVSCKMVTSNYPAIWKTGKQDHLGSHFVPLHCSLSVAVLSRPGPGKTTL